MAELNLKQITDKLNSEFTGNVRKLVFWYDAGAEFAEDIDTLELENAKILHLEPDNQFYIKYFLECEDKDTNYLIYAPFAKPAIRDNHLADMIHYSKEFFADRASLLTIDLGINEKYKSVIQHYIKFFASKERTQKFYDLEIESFNKTIIEIALMSVLCKNKTASFEEVLRAVLTDDGFEDNKYLAEFEKYDLLTPFWEQAEIVFGYQDTKPTLEKLVMTLFASYAAKTLHCDAPKAWEPFITNKTGNILAFLDNLMNSYLYGDKFDEISEKMYSSLDCQKVFSELDCADISDCTLFSGVDRFILKWIIGRLENEDVGAKLYNRIIPEVCEKRKKKHFGSRAASEYSALYNAFNIISMHTYSPVSGLDNVIHEYTRNGYKTDQSYREFYYWIDKIEDNAGFEALRDLIENIYTNEYLNKVTVNFTKEFAAEQGNSSVNKQIGFYSKFVRYTKERVVVIISDALRYETGVSLFELLQGDEKCTATIEPMQSVLPSYTRFGMAALLPHKSLAMTDKYQILVDEKPCDDLPKREAILKSANQNSKAVQFDDIKNMKVAELREVFTGMDVVYVYHNQIDARGDKLNTENEVFDACNEAVNEIHQLIKRLTTSANTVHFIVTADHGFIYKRDKLAESDKIGNIENGAFAGKRYVVSDNAVNAEGVGTIPLRGILRNDDKRIVSFPVGSDVFKVSGGGMNYVHGGCSPQEMIIPVIDVKTEKGHKETTTAKISLVSLTTKITNLITSLDFIQTEPVSDVVKEAAYKIYFVSENGEKISNENIYVADSKEKDTVKRVFKLRFSLKNQQYSQAQKNYIVAVDKKTGLETFRQEIVIDIAFANDFGFNI